MYFNLTTPNPYTLSSKLFIFLVLSTNRRLIDRRSIDISLGGIHNIVVGSDLDETFQEPVSVDDLSGIAADGTGVNQQKGRN